MKVIITGATGMIGKGVLLETLKDNRISEVLIINRSSVGIEHPKLKEVLHKDFSDLSPVKHHFEGFDAVYFCLGISSFRMSEEDYTRITYDITKHFAETVFALNPQSVFCFISGAGTDGTEKSRTMWQRVKGKAENVVLNMGFKDAYALRPAMIEPVGDVKSATAMYDVFITIARPIFPLIRRFKKYVTATDKIGQAMIHLSTNGYPTKVLESIEINKVAVGD